MFCTAFEVSVHFRIVRIRRSLSNGEQFMVIQLTCVDMFMLVSKKVPKFVILWIWVTSPRLTVSHILKPVGMGCGREASNQNTRESDFVALSLKRLNAIYSSRFEYCRLRWLWEQEQLYDGDRANRNKSARDIHCLRKYLFQIHNR